MRFLGIGEHNQLGALYLGLKESGHEVRVVVEVSRARDILKGMVLQIKNRARGLEWARKTESIVLFESASDGKLQDRLRREGVAVVGGSAYGDRLESDRQFGQRVLREIGLPTAPAFHFDSYDRAIAFVRRRPRRYVYKNNGSGNASTLNYVGEWKDGGDLIARLEFYRSHHGTRAAPDFILMEFIEGVEAGIGAYFNGEDFLKPALLDWEHKRFFPGDLGELTGEMGTVVTYRGAEALFEKTLKRLRPHLKRGGYCGYINLNMILNSRGIWPLEFTSRFGYPGFAICEALHEEGWDKILTRMTKRDGLTLKTSPGFAVGVVLTVPPFPYWQGYDRLSRGMPISFAKNLKPGERRHLHFGEISQKRGRLVTGGTDGYVMVVTGTGPTVPAARQKAYALIQKVAIPNMRYRNDIGLRVPDDRRRMKSWGYLK
jgi:phosphoribosylamine--glycine ligase